MRALIAAAALAGFVSSGAAQDGPTPILQMQTAEPAAALPGATLPLGKGFDFYVLSLSWSPTWCAENDAAGNTAQCDTDRSHAFVVHGLWPQNERGYPEFCRSREPSRVPESLGRSLFDIMPSMGLIGHQWRKHGTCSGLGQEDYFAVLRAAWRKVRMPGLDATSGRQRRSPAEIEAAIVGANRGLTDKGLAVTCDGGRLEEIRICLTPTLGFRDCPQVDRAGCRDRKITIPPPR